MEHTELLIQNYHKSKRGITLKQRNGKQPLLYMTHCSDLILIPIKLHEDILNGYRVMVCTRIFGKKLKGHNL